MPSSETMSVEISPALKMRVKMLLDSGLALEDIYARLCSGEIGPAQVTAALVALGIARKIAEASAPAQKPLAGAASTPDTPRQDGPALSSAAEAAPSPPAQDLRIPAPKEALSRPGKPKRGGPSFFEEAKRLFSMLNPPVDASAPGMVVEFIAARQGEGCSTIAREFARVATLHSDHRALLLDLDWQNSTHATYFNQDHDASRDGMDTSLGSPVDIGVDPSVLLRFTDGRQVADSEEPMISVHRVGSSSLYLTQPTAALRRQAGSALITNHPAFWTQLRNQVGITVIDTPPFSRSFDGLAVSGMADKVIVVVEAEETRVPVLREMIERLEAQGADVAGLVFNKRRFYIPRFIYRWL